MINEKLIKRAAIVLTGLGGIIILYFFSLNFTAINEFLINPQHIDTPFLDKMKISLIKGSENFPTKSTEIKEETQNDFPTIESPKLTDSEKTEETDKEAPPVEKALPPQTPDQLYPDNPSEFDLPDNPPKSGR